MALGENGTAASRIVLSDKNDEDQPHPAPGVSTPSTVASRIVSNDEGNEGQPPPAPEISTPGTVASRTVFDDKNGEDQPPPAPEVSTSGKGTDGVEHGNGATRECLRLRHWADVHVIFGPPLYQTRAVLTMGREKAIHRRRREVRVKTTVVVDLR